MTTLRMEIYGGPNHVSPALANVEIIAPGVGRMTCLECDGDPETYAARFGQQRRDLAPDGCVDCKNRGWVYVNA